MPFKVQPKDLIVYRNKLSRKQIHFDCPDCKLSLLPKEYEKHCFEEHGINDKITCVWCRNVSWDNGAKNRNALHLQNCFQKFLNRINESQFKLLSLKHAYPQKTLFEFTSLPAEEHDWSLDVDPPPVEFRDDNLNLAASYVAKYLETRDTHDWMHVMVKAITFDSFIKALNEDRGNTRTLSFSCWCNGGPYEQIKHRQHRHLIVVSPKNYFNETFWPKVTVAKEDRPNRNFPCKGYRKLQSPMHLVNTLGYISHRKSRCEFTFKYSKSTPFKMHHFYLYRTLPIDFKLPLVLLWEGGISTLLRQEKFQNVSIPLIAERPMESVKGQWKQKIKHFYKHERDFVLPVSKRYMPTKQETSVYLHLMNGKKLHFEICPENEILDDETWLRKQGENGNAFYNAVEEEMWTPRPRDQYILNFYKPVIDEVKKLRLKNADLKRRLKDSEQRNISKQVKLDLKQEKIENLYEKMSKNDEEEKAKMKMELEHYKRENEQFKQEIFQLKIRRK